MPRASVETTWSESVEDGKKTFSCTIKNNNEYIAFFIETAVLDKSTDQIIVPVFWNDNYISLLPGEERILKAQIDEKLLEGKEIDFRSSGWDF